MKKRPARGLQSAVPADNGLRVIGISLSFDLDVPFLLSEPTLLFEPQHRATVRDRTLLRTEVRDAEEASRIALTRCFF